VLNRLGYWLRETFASLRRNLTLTMAAVLTAAVSLLLLGVALLARQGVGNQLVQWKGGVQFIVLLFTAVVLIWNTIRTAMFARRREIEVMKLVGATNWFIRIPFMFEGLLHGLAGGLLAVAGLYGVNYLWKDRVIPKIPDLAALQVSSSQFNLVVILVLVVGMLVGAIGSAVAASRFLDV